MSNQPYKYDAILVDPDLNSRMRLKQATTAVTQFGAVQQVGTLQEATAKIQSSRQCDVIFLSYRFQPGEISEFIKKAKETKEGQDAAYVLVMKSNSGDGATIAQNVLGGADGMLFEPYSVDYLYEITNLAAKVRKERSGTREKAALQMLANDMVSQVDQLAYLKSCEMETVRQFKKLAESCAFVKGLSPESLQTYFDMVVNAFENAPLPTNVSKYKKYGGVSNRIKKRMEKKVVAELETKPTGSPDDKSSS
jgi:DNA-binding NtrC family response regulator